MSPDPLFPAEGLLEQFARKPVGLLVYRDAIDALRVAAETERLRSQGATCVGGSGSLTLSSWTSTRAGGSFEFALVPASVPGAATDQRSVTNGSFDVTF